MMAITLTYNLTQPMNFNEHPPTASAEEQLQLLAQKATPSDLARAASDLSAAELADLVSLLASQAAENGKKHILAEKICALVAGIGDAVKLQAVGRALDHPVTCLLLDAAAMGDEAIQHRLAPLLVGMAPTAFASTLAHANQDQLAALKEQALTEPLHHQLSLLAQALADTLDRNQLEFAAVQRQIQELPLADVDTEQLRAIAQAIESLRHAQLMPQQTINQALVVAWNTARPDLIEKFSHLKELYLKYVTLFIGIPANETTPSTGLYKNLRERLESVFSEKGDDSEAAIDALANFSIWYLQDYWEIGLLPDISNLEQQLAGKTESERASQRGMLFDMAKSHLEKIGLATLKDLKNAHIYSSKALKDYIDTHRK